MWSWDIVVDNCAICRNHIMDLCIECQANQVMRFVLDFYVFFPYCCNWERRGWTSLQARCLLFFFWLVPTSVSAQLWLFHLFEAFVNFGLLGFWTLLQSEKNLTARCCLNFPIRDVIFLTWRAWCQIRKKVKEYFVKLPFFFFCISDQIFGVARVEEYLLGFFLRLLVQFGYMKRFFSYNFCLLVDLLWVEHWAGYVCGYSFSMGLRFEFL